MGYTRPTNYELVKNAQAIVVANALTFQEKGKTRTGKSFGIFKFKVLERIKGDCRDEAISVEGDNDIRSWGDPNDFGFTKGDHGPCNPTDYELKGNYVLFLRSWKGNWLVGGPAFTRVNVLVEGTNAPWTRAVRQYARIAELHDYDKEKSALRALRSRALSLDPDCPEALAKDIDAHFSKPTPAKSFSDLLSLYNQANDPVTREYVLWACAHGEKQEAKDFFRSLLTTGEWPNYIHPVCSYVARVKLAGFHDAFASALGTNRVEHERRMLLVALNGGTEASELPLMQKVLESITGKEAVLLGQWFVKHPSPKAIRHLRKLAYADNHENHQLILVLAGMGDTYVLDWARDFVTRPSKDVWLGYYVFAHSPLPEADSAARQVIQQGDSPSLVWLVQGYEDSARPDRLDRVRDIVALKKKSQKLVFWLRRILGEWAYKGNKEAESLLSQLPVVEAE